jgi:hypothetical protein
MSIEPASDSQRKYIKNDKITHSFKDFFRHTRNYNTSSINISKGIIKQLESDKGVEFLQDIPIIQRNRSELLFSFLVDNFQTYLSELTLELFNHKPEVLSGGSTKNSIVFSSPDLETLKKTIIEKTILDLGYRNVNDIDQYFREKFGFSIVVNWLQEKRLARLIQIRNVIAHNRGKINRLFLFKVGAKFDREHALVGIPDLSATDSYLIDLAQSIDQRAILKFGLPTFN